MRFGQNPNKTALIQPPAKVVVLVITHLPEMESDYHRERFSVVIESVETHLFQDDYAHMNYDLIIWDNGSCDEFKQYLENMFPVFTLILSRNIGKTNALKSVLSMLPPETIVAYGDDDIEYFDNWLAPQIEILETFPNVGTVTGWPVRIASKWGETSTLQWAENEKQCGIETGNFIPENWEMDYGSSVGLRYDEVLAITKGLMDIRITYKGVSALATSQHCQFVGYAGRLAPLIPWTDRAMADEIPFDKAIDAAGYLRLATCERYTRHMGNVLEKERA